jgi:hypothetical protein
LTNNSLNLVIAVVERSWDKTQEGLLFTAMFIFKIVFNHFEIEVIMIMFFNHPRSCSSQIETEFNIRKLKKPFSFLGIVI